ncbi:MAG: hypothetical protein MJZ16_05345 [Bacteroidales bacterium]|nr:hypothetical protein [Bacteroidales bacterium]
MKTRGILFLLMVFLAVACGEPDPMIYVEGPSEYEVSYEASDIKISVVSNHSAWGFGSDAEWLIPSKESEEILLIKVKENESYDDRKGKVTVFTGTGSDDVLATVLVSQKAKPTPTLEVSPSETVKVLAEGGQVEIDVSTNQDSWGYKSEADWLTMQKSGSKLIVDVLQNTVESPRSAVVNIYAPDSDSYTILKSVAIEQDAAVIPAQDLSQSATSNSYIITAAGKYSFTAKVKGNGKGGASLSDPSSLDPSGVKLVWQTAVGMIKSVSLDENGNICFEAGDIPGNAVIAAVDESDNIIWSWHVWFPETAVASIKTKNGHEVMNLNLGALSSSHTDGAKTLGLLYQWGRKDPFPGAGITNGGNTSTTHIDIFDIDGNPVKISNSSWFNSKDNTLEYSISHPAVCMSNYSQYSSYRGWLTSVEDNEAFWGNPEGYKRVDGEYVNAGTKTYYDPCPAGWRVPDINVFKDVTSTGGLIWAKGDTYGDLTWGDLFGSAEFTAYDYNGDGKVNFYDWFDGWYLVLGPNQYSFFPAATRYDGQYAMLMGSMVGYWANYWYNAPSDGTNGLASAMVFGTKEYSGADSVTASGVSNGSRADAYSVRCVKE